MADQTPEPATVTENARAASYIAVAGNAGAVPEKAAQRFCEYMNRLPDAGVSLTVESHRDPASLLRPQGMAGLALVDGISAESLHPMFAVLNEPFMYASYESFSMTTNAEAVLRALSDATGLKVLSAYYTGSAMFLSPEPLDRIFAGNIKPGEQPPPTESAFAVTMPGTGTENGLSALLIPSEERILFSARFRELVANSAVIEAGAGELNGVSLFDAASDYDAGIDELVLTRSFHSAKPAWLLASPGFYDSLSPYGKAALEDAAAILYSDIDREYLALEEAAAKNAAEDGVSLLTATNALRSGILDAKAEDAARFDGEEEFRALLDSVS